MKTLEKHSLLYDEACPMCQWYTGAFVKRQFLDLKGRQLYEEGINIYPVDEQRARHEIALVNRETQEVLYGTDSLLRILEHRWPWMAKAGKWKPLRYLIDQFYRFISYNRKVIAVDTRPLKQQQCTPDFHGGYRWAYLIFAWLLTATILTGYGQLLTPWIPVSNLGREFLICGGQFLFQGLLLWRVGGQVRTNYWGHMMTVSVIGGLLLLPLLIGAPILHFLGFDAGVFVGWFMAVVVFMTFLHAKRVKALGLPFWLTVSWLVYRLLVLGIMIK